MAAIEATKHRLALHLPQELQSGVRLLHQCHSSFPADVAPGSVALIVYNLGYLPGGDKALTEQVPDSATTAGAANRRALLDALDAASLEVEAFLPAGDIRVRDLLLLKPGSILELPPKADTPIEGHINGVAKFQGELVTPASPWDFKSGRGWPPAILPRDRFNRAERPGASADSCRVERWDRRAPLSIWPGIRPAVPQPL